VVVLDLGLPDVDGYAVLEHLKQMEGLRGATFVALTGRGSDEDRHRIREAGFAYQFLKPAPLQELIALIREKLAGPEA
jgi:DNA-binding response OmpR family regulator